VLGRLRASLVHGPIEGVREAERANQNDEDQQEREEPEEPAVGQRGRVSRHRVREELPNRAHAKLDNPSFL
jgi:hypothetical protein